MEGLMTEFYLGMIEQSENEQSIFEAMCTCDYMELQCVDEAVLNEGISDALHKAWEGICNALKAIGKFFNSIFQAIVRLIKRDKKNSAAQEQNVDTVTDAFNNDCEIVIVDPVPGSPAPSDSSSTSSNDTSIAIVYDDEDAAKNGNGASASAYNKKLIKNSKGEQIAIPADAKVISYNADNGVKLLAYENMMKPEKKQKVHQALNEAVKIYDIDSFYKALQSVMGSDGFVADFNLIESVMKNGKFDILDKEFYQEFDPSPSCSFLTKYEYTYLAEMLPTGIVPSRITATDFNSLINEIEESTKKSKYAKEFTKKEIVQNPNKAKYLLGTHTLPAIEAQAKTINGLSKKLIQMAKYKPPGGNSNPAIAADLMTLSKAIKSLRKVSNVIYLGVYNMIQKMSRENQRAWNNIQQLLVKRRR